MPEIKRQQDMEHEREKGRVKGSPKGGSSRGDRLPCIKLNLKLKPKPAVA